MALVLLVLCLVLFVPGAAAGQSSSGVREWRFTGSTAASELCACLLDLQRDAEIQGRLDFTAEVESTSADGSSDLIARVYMGSAHVVGRINFEGHSRIDDSTLRRAITIYERDLLDVAKLRRSLARINDIGVFEPLTLADVSISRRDDGVTADLMISLRERKPRWWSLSGPMIPGVGMLQASLAARLPPWGRGALEAATYFVSLNMVGFAKPFLALQRAVIPGQELLSGFAISPAMSPWATLRHYGLAHLEYRLGPMLDAKGTEPIAVPVTKAGQPETEPLVCVPPKARLWWLRRGAAMATKVALGALIP